MKVHPPDYALLIITVSLLVLGILVLASISASISQERFGNTYYFLKHQVLYGLLPGIALGFLLFKIPLAVLRKWSLVLFSINLVFLGLVFLPRIGSRAFGASRWISLGPFSFQPSEFLKITFILYLAAWLVSLQEKKEKQSNKIIFAAFFMIIGLVSLILILQPHISTLGIVMTTAILMYFVSNTSLWHCILVVLIGITILVILVKITPYRMSRILVFLNPDIDPMGKGYQIKQALIAAGSGRIFGVGLGMSRQKLGFLPQSLSDTTFAIFAEEVGFVGSFILIFLFFLFLWRGFTIAKKSNDKFSQLAAFGISSWITLQAFVNIGAIIGILPLTGVPLPFISYGGSALISELLGVGILLNISKNTT